MTEPPKLRDLKAASQRLRPLLRIGRLGITPDFLAALDQALDAHELVKVRFEEFKAQKKVLAPELATRSGSRLVMRVGNVAVYYRQRTGSENPMDRAADRATSAPIALGVTAAEPLNPNPPEPAGSRPPS